jgi:crotonobetainyl-CoA:carnitine CoA-transferase CaiB-like acyl-CoA transferase
MLNFDINALGPLEGVRVLDMTRLIAGNMLSLQLADFGAEVIKIEPAGKGDPLRAWKDNGIDCHWKVYSRNKKSLSLNLREPEAINIVLKLVENSDVLVENFRPGRLEKIGLGPDILHQRNKNLIITRISGWGQTGPYKDRPGFGSLVEAMSGFASRNGFPDREPVLPPLALADMITGLYGAMAVLIALREVEGKHKGGQVIDLSLLEPIFSVLGPEALTHKVTGKVKQRLGSGSNTSSPRNAYLTRDGKWIALSASIQSMAERVFKVIGRKDMIDDPRFSSNQVRVKNRLQIDKILGEWINSRDQAEVLEIFAREEVTASGIYDIQDIVKDEHFSGRQVLVDLPDKDVGIAPMHNIIPRLSDTPGSFRLPAPELGEHNAEILDELGIDKNLLEDLEKRGVI